jgi:hypothetical protein
MILKNINFDKLIIFFFFCLPFFIIYGPFLAETIVLLIALSGFFIFKRKEIKEILLSRIIFFFLIFYIYLNINSFFSFDSIVSLKTTLPYLRMIFFAIALSIFLKKILNLKKIILISFLFSYIILFLDSIFQIIMGHNILGYPLINSRVSSFFGSKLIMGSFVSRTLPILLAITFIENFKNKKLLQIFILILSGSLVFFSAERLALAYYFIILFLFFILTVNRKNIFIFFLFFITFVSILYFFKPSSWNRLAVHTITQMKESNNVFGFSYRHELHYITAYHLFLDNKFIGNGIKSFRNLCENDSLVKTKILKDNKFYSPFKGFLFISEDDDVFYILTNPDYDYFLKNLNFFISEDNAKYKDKDYIQIRYNNKSGAVFFNKKNADYVSQGEYIGSFYDFKNGCNTHPHNIHLEFLAELGFFGYIFLLIFFSYTIFLIFKLLINIYLKYKMRVSKKESEYNFYFIFILIGLFNSLFPLFPSGSFFNNWLSIVFYLNLSFLINNKNLLTK